MGEKIKEIKEIKLADHSLLIEMNKGTHRGGKYDIHIQNDEFRLNITEGDFCKMVLSILYARDNLVSYKGPIKH